MSQAVLTQDVRTIGIAAAATVLLYASGFLVLFTPLPLMYVFFARGRGAGVATSIASLTIIVLLYVALMPWLNAQEPGKGFLMLALPGIGLIEQFSLGSAQFFGGAYFVFFLAVAIALGEGARKNWTMTRWGGSAVVAGLASMAIAVLLVKVFSGAAIIGDVRGYLQSVIAEIVELNRSAGVNDFRVQYLTQHGEAIASYLIYLLPSLLFVFVLLAVVLNMLVGRRFVRALPVHVRYRRAVNFKLPEQLIWIGIGCGIAYFANTYVLKTSFLTFVALNGVIALAALYFFQGVAVLVFFLERMRMRILRVLIYIAIIVFFQSVGLVLVGVGVADVWIDFRKRLRFKAENQ